MAKKSTRVQIFFDDVGLTKQSFKDECNVNNIMAKFQKTGLLPHVDLHKGQYGDFTSVQDYHTSLNQVLAAQDMFMSLTSSVRAKFNNDPAQFLSFVDNPDNREEMRSMGLLKPESVVPNVVPLDTINTETPPV